MGLKTDTHVPGLMESQLAIDAGKTDENLSYSDLKSNIPIALHSHLESRESFEAKELEKWKAIEKVADLDVHTHNKAQKFPLVTNKEGSFIKVFICLRVSAFPDSALSRKQSILNRKRTKR